MSTVFEQTPTGVFMSVTHKYAIFEMWPDVWWVFADEGRRNAEGRASMDHVGPDHPSYDEAVEWATEVAR